MKTTSVSIAEGKKEFSKIIQTTIKKKTGIVITKRGTPVAAIIPYNEYMHSKRLEGYIKILDGRESFIKAGIKAKDIFTEVKKELDNRV